MELTRRLPDDSIHAIITSIPYWALRTYRVRPRLWGGDPDHQHAFEACGTMRLRRAQQLTDPDKQGTDRTEFTERGRLCGCGAWEGALGCEPTPTLYVRNVLLYMRELVRVLHPTGTIWLNLGDSWATSGGRRATPEELEKDRERALERYPTQAFAGHDGWDRSVGTAVEGLKAKDLCGIPHRVAFALRDYLGLWLRDDIVWHKPDAPPNGIADRPMNAKEYVFLLSKRDRYFYDREAYRLVGEATLAHPEAVGENPTSSKLPKNVWTIPAKNTIPKAVRKILGHHASFPLELVRPCILASTSARGCCPLCAEPWWPTWEPAPGYKDRLGKGWHDHTEDLHRGQRCGAPGVPAAPYLLQGWRQGCACPPLDPIPARVLDPFMGSGTTGEQAIRLGRHALGFELHPRYARFADWRMVEVDSGGDPRNVPPALLDELRRLAPVPA